MGQVWQKLIAYHAHKNKLSVVLGGKALPKAMQICPNLSKTFFC